MKKLSIIAACLLTVGMLGGCGTKFDAAGYTKAILDNSYKNDSTDFVAMKIGTAEEAADLYEQGMDSEMDGMLASAGSISEAQEQEFRQVFEDILAGAKYTVGEAEKQDDGSYVVTISYEKMHVFGPAAKTYMDAVMDLASSLEATAMSGGDIPSDDELTSMIVDLLKDSLVEAYQNVTYDAAETMTVTIELNNNEYSPNENDLMDLEMAMFDIDDFLNNLQ